MKRDRSIIRRPKWLPFLIKTAAAIVLFAPFLQNVVKADAPVTSSSLEDLRALSIDDLANLRVTSVSKRPEPLSSAPAAIYVITSSDIRRLGVTSLPEVLRLAPNLEVARINAYSWTVTARGFNSPETANKLLVLVDGRSVYEPIGSGVLWQQVNVALDNIERIEVVSGPGGTLWGANAVNGVINIITKDASATQGFYARATSGVYKRSATIRYGGSLGQHANYRIFADGFTSSSTKPAVEMDALEDALSGVHGGFRIDSAYNSDTFTIKGDAYNNTLDDDSTRFSGYDILVGWSHRLRNGSSVAVEAYVDQDERDEPTLFESRNTFHIDAQYTTSIGNRQQLIWGGELRHWKENFVSYNAFHFADPKTTISLGSLFVQDEITLRPELKLTLGIKAETNSYSGVGWLPNLRIAWQANSDTLLWAAISQAMRTPNRIERELEADPFLVPSPDFQSEKLTAYEMGWKAQPNERSALSLSAFYNVYDDLRTYQYPETIFPLMLKNGGRGTTYGLEGWGKYEVMPGWRLSGGFNLLHKDFELKPGYNDLTNLSVGGQDPDYQAQVRSEWNVTDTVDFDIGLRTVGKVTTAPVPAYTEANIHLGWRVRDKIELSLNGSNLLNPRHLEVWDPSTTSPRYVGRSILISLRYGY